MTSTVDPPPVQGAPRINRLSRLAGVVVSPAETFRDIAARPDLTFPLILVFVLTLLTTMVTFPRIDFEPAWREQFEKQKMSEEKIDEMVTNLSKFQQVIALSGAVAGFLFLLAIAGVLLLAFKVMGGEGTFKQAMSIVAYAWVPQLIAGLLAIPLLIRRGTVSPLELPTILKSNLGFLTDPSTNATLFALLSSIDVFMIWTLILLVLGFSVMSRFSRGKTAAIVISLWVLVVLIKTAMASLQAMGSGA